MGWYDQVKKPRVTAIVAYDANRAIGKDGKMPWNNPEDLKLFRQTTTGNTVVMGRKTFDAIGKPLPNRLNIVISRSGGNVPGVLFAPSIPDAVNLSAKNNPGREVFIIGGGSIYSQAVQSGIVDRVMASELFQEPVQNADTFFPQLPNWQKASVKPYGSFNLVEYQRPEDRAATEPPLA